MLDISLPKVTQIIQFGHEVERAEHELRGFIESLNEDEATSLIALMWVGRDSFAADEYRDALSTARQEAVTPTADYLLGTPHFADHLETGLELLGLTDGDED